MNNNFPIESAAISDRGLSKKRPNNEDSFIEIKDSRIFAVADGVGGAQAGDVASQMAMEILGEAFINWQNGYDAEAVMKSAIEKANSAIFQMSHELAQLSTMATTVVALHIDGNIATIGHVGDSRLYRFDRSGRLFRETQDHSLVEEEVRAGRMTPEQAQNHPSKNVISRAVGADSTVEVDLKTIMFEPNTVFLICSDGITRHIEDAEIAELLKMNLPASEACRKMKEICYERGAEDNLTAVIIRILETAPAEEIEAPTVATARASSQSEIPKTELPTERLEFPAQINNPNNISIPALVEEQAVTVPEPSTVVPVTTYDKNELPKSISSVGRFLSYLLVLVIGLGLGAGIYSLLKRPEETVTQVPDLPAQNTDLTMTPFEKNRRNVDHDPAGYIRVNQQIARDAEDFYLLGRAYLITGKYQDARQAFLSSRERLTMAGGANTDVLKTDIAAGIAIIDGQFSRQEFEKQINPNNDSGENANVQTNQNNNPINLNSNAAIQ